ncbi:hypothetical protein B0J13DRAFT_586070 [Dactylonectria estremocensis]|uniref:Uncharacterized protein n=1 Tax=Dactylonectria estremocensis TaxID=1079267 RepID=A0A9P9ENG5_9HYPO|nr:hypothetical protein B0J13DRAFT_586070 [Dactylonectria estremocensis]
MSCRIDQVGAGLLPAKERALEEHVYEIRDGSEPDHSKFRGFSKFVINLDHEVLKINDGMHYKLDNIPRKGDLWPHALSNSTYKDMPPSSWTFPNEKIGYAFRLVTPKTDIKEPRMAFLTKLMAQKIHEYKIDVEGFGLGWSPDSFPFRELTFALVSMPANQVEFHSFSAKGCRPRSCYSSSPSCTKEHIQKSPGWLDAEWTDEKGMLLELGAISHRPCEPPGVFVSLVLVVDGEAITNAVTWGLEQSRVNFHVVVISLFDVAFAERGDLIFRSSCMGSERRLRIHFPGFAALLNFFDAATSRRTPPKSAGSLLQEMCDQILDFVDYEAIVAGPFVRLEQRRLYPKERLLSLNFENMENGKRFPVMPMPRRRSREMYNWVPVIGSDRKAIILEIVVQFESAEGVPVEEDSEDSNDSDDEDA